MRVVVILFACCVASGLVGLFHGYRFGKQRHPALRLRERVRRLEGFLRAQGLLDEAAIGAAEKLGLLDEPRVSAVALLLRGSAGVPVQVLPGDVFNVTVTCGCGARHLVAVDVASVP